MLEAVKTHLTEIKVGGLRPRMFRVPEKKAQSMLILIGEYEVDDDIDNTSVSVEEAFGWHYGKTSKAASILRGFRTRDDLTQIELAKLVGSSQSAIASMEAGRRPIGKSVAHKLAAIFDTDYRVFL